MQKRKKQLLGLLGLAVVVAMTIFAYTMPSPDASAMSKEVPVTVQVVREGKIAEIKITSLNSGDVVVNREITLGYQFAKANNVKLFIKNQGQVSQTQAMAETSTTPEDGEIEIPLETSICNNNNSVAANGDVAHELDAFTDCTVKYSLPGELAGQYGVSFALRAVAVNGDTDGTGTDALGFYYRSAKFVGDPTFDANGDPVVKIGMSSDVKSGILVVFDENGKPVFGNSGTEEGKYAAIPFNVCTTGTSCETTVTIPFKTNNIPTGKYSIVLVAYGAGGESDLIAVAETGINYNVNGGSTPGGNRPGGSTDPTDPNNPNYDPNDPNNPNNPNRPNVPDTGLNLLNGLNISQADYIITGLLAFGFVTGFAIFLIVRRNRR